MRKSRIALAVFGVAVVGSLVTSIAQHGLTLGAVFVVVFNPILWLLFFTAAYFDRREPPSASN